jgi:hypothetical protein
MVFLESTNATGVTMISEKQLEANRRNAQHSTGPQSAAARKRVSLNNLRHGLTGQTTVLSPEDRAAHDKFCADLLSCLKPENALELQVAQSIADDHWRLNRVFAIETNIYALGHFESPAGSEEYPEDPDIHDALNSARVFLADAKQFALLSIYEQRIHRNLQKSILQLRDLQTARRQQPPVPPLSKPRTNSVNTLPSPRPENGFEFANEAIRQVMAAGSAWNPSCSTKISTVAAT